MLSRIQDKDEVKKRLSSSSVVAILGPRQCGKTTLAKSFKAEDFFDLEDPVDLEQLERPMQRLEGAQGLVVIDEIQRRPELSALRVLVDRNPKLRFLILGSASRDLIRQSSETLAGRVSYFQLGGFGVADVGLEKWKKLWLRGGFPRSFLARTEPLSLQWRNDYITTFLERDIPQLGISIPARTLRRFWTMMAHFHGQVIQYSEIGRSFGISDMTVRRYLEILEGTFMVSVLAPWWENISKRLVKHPKIYIADSGIFHALMDLENPRALQKHPKLGASFEGFVFSILQEKLKPWGVQPYFWATHSGAELDFFWQRRGQNFGLEVKFSDAPKLTPSMRSAAVDLKLDFLYVVYPGSKSYHLDEKVKVLSMSDFLELKISK